MLSQAVKSSHALVLPETEAEHRDGEFCKHNLLRKDGNEATGFLQHAGAEPAAASSCSGASWK